ncbi:MAG: hypothetical protein ABI960_09545, partial [Candidatus Eisenbacteria bacterium]
ATGPWQVHGSISYMLQGKKDVPYDYNLEPDYWFASEHYSEAGPTTTADYFCVVHAYDAPPEYNPPTGSGEDISVIEFRQMIWHPDGTFDLAAPNPVRSLDASTPRARLGETIQLSVGVESGVGRQADLQVVRIVGAQETPVAPQAVGLPATVNLGYLPGPVTIPWTLRSGGFALPATFEVRVASQPLRLSTQVTVVATDGSSDQPPADAPVTRARPLSALSQPPGVGDAAAEPRQLQVREIGSTPLGGGRGLLIEMPEAGPARIEVYDVLGRRVRSLAVRDLPRGATIELWDGHDDQGRAVQRGIYFARVSTPFGRASGRFLVLD